jgi:hypothetical protein
LAGVTFTGFGGGAFSAGVSLAAALASSASAFAFDLPPAPADGVALAAVLDDLLSGRLGLRDPVTHEQAHDQRHQQHRHHAEEAGVAAQPAGRAGRLEQRGVRECRPGRSLSGVWLTVVLEHVEERQPHRRAWLTARQAIALIGDERRSAARARRAGLLGGHGHQAHVRRRAQPNAPRT